MLTSIINAFSVIYIAIVISVATMGIISFVAWIRDVPQPPPAREVVEPTTPLPTYQETGTDSGGSVDSDATVVEDSPCSSISFDSSSSSTEKGFGHSSSFRLKLKFLNEPGSNIKKISRGLTQSVVPALRRTQTMSKEAAVRLVAPFSKERRCKTSSSLSRPSRRLSRTFTHIVKTCKLGQSSSSAIDMVRELSNGHCREITLSEQAMGMSRQLSSNHALCTGW